MIFKPANDGGQSLARRRAFAPKHDRAPIKGKFSWTSL